MKHLILILSIFISFHANAQDENNVTLVVVGQGVTQTEAQNNALRSAIEQSFGTFISSNTELLNDSLIKDEIISVSNGNIKKFEILSSDKISDNNYSVTLNATVSIDRLSSFTESKGGATKFSGKLFATNVLMIEFYAKNELIAIKNMITTLKSIAENAFNYEIQTADPFKKDDKWICPYQVNITRNKNFLLIPSTITKTINSLTLSEEELESYTKLNLSIFPITFAMPDEHLQRYFLRNKESVKLITDFFTHDLPQECSNFQISNGYEKYQFGSKSINYATIEYYKNDQNYQIFWEDGEVYRTGYGGWINLITGGSGWSGVDKNNPFGFGRPRDIKEIDKISVFYNSTKYNDVEEKLRDMWEYCDGYGNNIYALKNIINKTIKKSKKLSEDEQGILRHNTRSFENWWNYTSFGYIICFFGPKQNNYIQKENDWVLSFKGEELRNIEEIEKITKWEVSKK